MTTVKIGRNIALEKNACPYCTAPLDTCFGVGKDVRPKPGDVSVCACCANALVFEDEWGKIRKPNDEEAKEISDSKLVQTLIKATKEARRAKPSPYQANTR